MKTLLYFFTNVLKGLLLILVLFIGADYFMPLDVEQFKQHKFARLIVAEDGTPLRAFADPQGIWRYPVSLEQVSPRYINTLINYEDRWFWYHPGVNPLAILRASVQNLFNGRIISGGSTLTMQVARIIEPHPRTIRGKLRQIFRALQLEWHYSKKQILTLYLNFAPFGGPLEGVEAASFAYLNKSARELSVAEAALLSVLPQSPTRFRPDKHPQRATQARNKVLERLYQFGILSRVQVDDARQEIVVPQLEAQPMIAPVLTRRLKNQVPDNGVLTTTIDINLQRILESLVKNYAYSLVDKTSAAILVVDHNSMAVKAYVASADFFDRRRHGQVDMIRAIRSPGSTLKPFLYALAMDQGLVSSHSMLRDEAINVSGYKPENFSGHFSGAVSLSEALQRSLNIPAIQVLQFLGPGYFMSSLENVDLKLYLPASARSNLAIILGGAGLQMEKLVQAYTAFSRGGRVAQLRYLARPSGKDDSKAIKSRFLMSEGAAWIVRDILSQIRERQPLANMIRRSTRLAWKTGTSYGFRDAWAIGMTDDYTIGVWTGRPDGTPVPGQFGARTAIPLLNEVVQVLPQLNNKNIMSMQQPDSVSRQTICWPGGKLLAETPEQECRKIQRSWVLNQTIAPTLASSPKIEDALQELKITSVDDETYLSTPPEADQPVIINLAVNNSSNGIFWFINGQPVNYKPVYHSISYTFKDSGAYQISAIDRTGKVAQVRIHIRHTL